MNNPENRRRYVMPLEFFSMLAVAFMLVMVFIYFLFM
jgi:hypothetical protein